MTPYEMIMFWQSLYPHEIGDEITKDIMEAEHDK